MLGIMERRNFCFHCKPQQRTIKHLDKQQIAFSVSVILLVSPQLSDKDLKFVMEQYWSLLRQNINTQQPDKSLPPIHSFTCLNSHHNNSFKIIILIPDNKFDSGGKCEIVRKKYLCVQTTRNFVIIKSY